MTYFNRLWRVEIISLISLFLCGVLMALLGYIDKLLVLADGTFSIISPIGAAWIMFGYTVTIGLLPTILYGATFYTFIYNSKSLKTQKIFVVSILPGIFCFFYDYELAGWGVACGLLVGFMVHFISSMWGQRIFGLPFEK